MQCLPKWWAPIAFEGQNSAEDRNRRLGRKRAAGVRDRKAGAMETSHTSDFVLRVLHHLGSNRLLRLKDTVNALGRNYSLPFILENKRRVLPIKHYDVDLFAE